MKVAYWFATVLALTVGISFAAADPASAWCGWRCRGAVAVMPSAVVMPAPVIVSPAAPAVVVSVPAPNPMMLRAPCGGGCVGAGAVGYAYAPVTNVHVTDCRFDNVAQPDVLEHVRDLTFTNVAVNGTVRNETVSK